MTKYFKLYLSFLKFSLSNSLQFRFDFTFRIIMDVIFYVVNILFFTIVFQHTSLIGDWNQDQVLIFVSGFLIVDAIQMTFFSNNVWMLSVHINKGDLDYYLLRPVSDLFFLTLREFALNSFINLIIAVGIFFYFLSQSQIDIPVQNIILYFILIINGAYIHLLIRLMTIIPVFWTHSGRGLEMVFWTVERFAERPDMIFKGILRGVLLTVLPLIAICSFPARVLFGENILEITGYCFLVSFIFTIVMNFLWKQGLKAYTSASS